MINRFGSILVLIFLMISLSSERLLDVESGFVIPLQGKFFTTDVLGNIFLVKSDNSIVKYNKLGIRQANVNFKIYGNVTQLDVTNPFEIYAYYRDQQTVIILDNQLSQRAVISLTELSTGEITSACRSFDNGLWYFDAGNMKLFKVNKSLVKNQESMPLATWTSSKWTPTQMLDNEKNVFVNDPNNGISIFDVFANYYKTVEIKDLNDFQVKKDKIYFYKEGYFQRFDFKFLSYDTLTAAIGCKSIRFDADQLYTWTNDSLYVKPFNE